ncbi:MAG TPA: YtxH domain-containing protein [Terriglobia bacterium]|nr:YtxH domain-containing protein [Terriglobia bacterium]
MNTSNGSRSVTIFLAGLSVGAVTALLLAPKSGKETRELIGRKAEEGSEYVAAKGRELRRQAEDFVDRGRKTAERVAERGKAFADRVAG